MKATITVVLNGLLAACLVICPYVYYSTFISTGQRHKNGIISTSPASTLARLQPQPSEANDTNGTEKASQLARYVKLVRSVRLLCWVMTGPTTILDKGKAVHETWGKRCSKLLFMTSERDRSNIDGRVSLPGVVEGRLGLREKAKQAWRHVWENYGQDFDWFYKCDDDTFTIVENLKFMIYPLPLATPFYTGMNLQGESTPYASGGAGYVLNRPALRSLFAQIDEGCMEEQGNPHEDQAVAVCLRKAGITLTNSQDARQRNRFLPLSPELHLASGSIGRTDFRWLFDRALGSATSTKRTVLDGPDCCSSLAISFHYIKPAMQYALDYLVYQLHLFGDHTQDWLYVQS